MTRARLPNRRAVESIVVEHNENRFTATVGFYDDGRPSEIFLNVSNKVGSGLDDAARDVALLTSLALQHGCPASDLVKSLEHNGASAMSGAVLKALAEFTPAPE